MKTTPRERGSGRQVGTAAAGVALALALLGGGRAFPAVIAGGGPARSDCYAVLDVDVEGASATGTPAVITCTDGQTCNSGARGDGACDIPARLCINRLDVAGCEPPIRLDKLVASGGFDMPRPETLVGRPCGDLTTIRVKTRKGGTKPGKAKLTVTARAPRGTTPRRDVDRYVFVCQPRPAREECRRSAPGLPAKLALEVPAGGSDLDLGFSGFHHNFTVTAQSKLEYCLTGCDATSNPVCTASGATGAGTDNGPTFGAPQPLLASGVAVCVVNRFRDPDITGTFDLRSGDMQSTVNLLADTYVRLGKNDLVCPRCDIGRCLGGKRDGQRCTVNGTATVLGSIPGEYALSTDCLPEGEPASSLPIDLPLTTGTATSPPGPLPCSSAVGQLFNDSCASGATCIPTCSSEIAPKGGINQTCCSNDPNLPCFPTKSGGSIVRTGTPVPPTPAWPGPTWPKTSEGSTLVATFCIARTGDSSVDGTYGLPGPGAIILPVTQNVSAQP